ncbi:MAG: hypothetical protein AAFQ80_01280 [Cyanobacteria bacterium J06621_8]
MTDNTQSQELLKSLQNVDGYVEQLITDWNAPGIGVGIVAYDLTSALSICP